MKDYSVRELEEGRPDIDAIDGIEFCLKCLYDDKNLVMSDRFGDRLSAEELIGVLLVARDEINTLRDDIDMLSNEL